MMLDDVMTQGSRPSDKPDDLAHPRASRHRRRPPPLHIVIVAPRAHASHSLHMGGTDFRCRFLRNDDLGIIVRRMF